MEKNQQTNIHFEQLVFHFTAFTKKKICDSSLFKKKRDNSNTAETLTVNIQYLNSYLMSSISLSDAHAKKTKTKQKNLKGAEEKCEFQCVYHASDRKDHSYNVQAIFFQ